jgi:hypothetical protein
MVKNIKYFIVLELVSQLLCLFPDLDMTSLSARESLAPGNSSNQAGDAASGFRPCGKLRGHFRKDVAGGLGYSGMTWG